MNGRLIFEIDQARRELHQLVEGCGTVSHPDVIAKSEAIDRLILQWHRADRRRSVALRVQGFERRRAGLASVGER